MANEITKVTDKNNVDYPLRDAAAQTALTGILDGQSIDSFGDVESALDAKFPRSEQNILGAKNLLPFPYHDNTKETNGITFTVNNDGTVTADGTSTADAYFECIWWTGTNSFPYKNMALKLNGCPVGGSASAYRLDIGEAYNDPSWLKDYGEGVTIPYNHFNSNTQMIQIRIVIRSGQTVSNLTFKPMLRFATDTDDTYAPYAMTNRELTDFAKHTKTITLGTNSSYTFTFHDASANENVHACFLALMSSTGGLEVNVLAGYRISNSAGNIKTIAGAATGSFDTTTGKFTINADGPHRTLTIIANAEILE